MDMVTDPHIQFILNMQPKKYREDQQKTPIPPFMFDQILSRNLLHSYQSSDDSLLFHNVLAQLNNDRRQHFPCYASVLCLPIVAQQIFRTTCSTYRVSKSIYAVPFQ